MTSSMSSNMSSNMSSDMSSDMSSSLSCIFPPASRTVRLQGTNEVGTYCFSLSFSLTTGMPIYGPTAYKKWKPRYASPDSHHDTFMLNQLNREGAFRVTCYTRSRQLSFADYYLPAEHSIRNIQNMLRDVTEAVRNRLCTIHLRTASQKFDPVQMSSLLACPFMHTHLSTYTLAPIYLSPDMVWLTKRTRDNITDVTTLSYISATLHVPLSQFSGTVLDPLSRSDAARHMTAHSQKTLIICPTNRIGFWMDQGFHNVHRFDKGIHNPSTVVDSTVFLCSASDFVSNVRRAHAYSAVHCPFEQEVYADPSNSSTPANYYDHDHDQCCTVLSPFTTHFDRAIIDSYDLIKLEVQYEATFLNLLMNYVWASGVWQYVTSSVEDLLPDYSRSSAVRWIGIADQHTPTPVGIAELWKRRVFTVDHSRLSYRDNSLIQFNHTIYVRPTPEETLRYEAESPQQRANLLPISLSGHVNFEYITAPPYENAVERCLEDILSVVDGTEECCPICYERIADVRFDCRHRVCSTCALKLTDMSQCVMCRARSQSLVRLTGSWYTVLVAQLGSKVSKIMQCVERIAKDGTSCIIVTQSRRMIKTLQLIFQSTPYVVFNFFNRSLTRWRVRRRRCFLDSMDPSFVVGLCCLNDLFGMHLPRRLKHVLLCNDDELTSYGPIPLSLWYRVTRSFGFVHVHNFMTEF